MNTELSFDLRIEELINRGVLNKRLLIEFIVESRDSSIHLLRYSQTCDLSRQVVELLIRFALCLVSI